MVALFCLGIGRYSLTMLESVNVLQKVIIYGAESVSSREYSVIINMRLSRILLGLICGAGLAVAGVGLQSLFSNPLVSPDNLGVTAGASFGAAVALMFDANMLGVQLIALIFGGIAVFLTYLISTVRGERKIIMLILSGIVITALFSGFVSLIKYIVDTEEKLPNITYWLMGSLYTSNFKNIMLGTPAIIAGSFILYTIRWKMNILSLSELEAKSLGLNIKLIRVIVIICSTMITASVVSLCGPIGWIGLLVPHMSRMIFGSDNIWVIPASMSLGATFLVAIDTLSRSIAVSEIPVSILLAVVGAPIFIALLRKSGIYYA